LWSNRPGNWHKVNQRSQKEVAFVLESSTPPGVNKQHELYLKLMPKQKAIVAKYATENGVFKAICRFLFLSKEKP